MKRFHFAKPFVLLPQMRVALGLALAVVLLAAPEATAADANTENASAESPSAESDTSWVTSIAELDGQGFVFGQATGLLLRPGTVSRLGADLSGKPETLYEHPAAVWAVDATQDGKTVVSGDYRGNLITYDVASKTPTTHEKAFERWCQAITMSPDDQSVLAGNESGKLFVWNMKDAKVSKSVELGKASITCIATSPDQKQLAITDGTGTVHLLSWPAMEQVGKIAISEETAWCVAYADPSTLIVGSADRNLYRVAAKADAKPESIAKGTDWITRIAVSSDGQIAASEVSGKIHFTDGSSLTTIGAESGVWALCFKAPGKLLVGTRKNGIVTAGQSWTWKPIGKPNVVQEADTEQKVEADAVKKVEADAVKKVEADAVKKVEADTVKKVEADAPEPEASAEPADEGSE